MARMSEDPNAERVAELEVEIEELQAKLEAVGAEKQRRPKAAEDRPTPPEDMRAILDEVREEQYQLRAQLAERERGVLERRAEVREAEQEAQRLRADLEERELQAKRLSAELERQDGRRGLFGRLQLRLRSYSALRRENAELRAEVKRLRKFEHLTKGAGGAVARLVAGRELREAFRGWTRVTREAKGPRDLFSQESADLGTAIVRRVIRVGLVGLVMAIVPAILAIGLTTWQNILIREQNAKIQIQIEQQASDTLHVRRAQLLATIYEQECQEIDQIKAQGQVDVDVHSRICKPEAHPRARQEAVIVFSEIERDRGV